MVYEQELRDAVDRSRSCGDVSRIESADPRAALGELRQLYVGEDVDFTEDGDGGYDVWACDDDAPQAMAWRVRLVPFASTDPVPVGRALVGTEAR